MNIATGLAELVNVRQNPAAAVDRNAAAMTSIPAAGAVATTIGTSTADRAERDCITRCATSETTSTATTNTIGCLPTRENAASAIHCAAPVAVSAIPRHSVAAMNSSSVHGIVLTAAGSDVVPIAGAVAITAPTIATTAGDTPWWASVHHSRITAPTSMITRRCGSDSGPGDAGSDTRRRSRRSEWCVNISSATSAARCDHTSASGTPSSSHGKNPMPAPVAVARISLVIRCAPAPSSDPIAENRMTAGNTSARHSTTRRRSRSTVARPRNTGSASAARPDVDGIANVVTVNAAVTR